MDQSRWSACVITPFRPRRRMNASDTRNGGEISGRRLMSETKRLPGVSVRGTEYARNRAAANVMTVETGGTKGVLTRIRQSRHGPKNYAQLAGGSPHGPATLV